MKRALPALLSCAAIAAGCADDGSDDPTAERPSASQGVASTTQDHPAEVKSATGTGAPSAGRRGPLVKLRDSQFGPVLFDGRDRALYLFTRDSGGKPRCYGACAEAWPPFYAKGRPRAGRGVGQSLLATIERRDGRRQVTYKGQPLYFYVHDPRGQVLCNDVAEFGGTWFALDAKGSRPS
jgi:predicted lipoprotein with Yx(FWY)xxD motif